MNDIPVNVVDIGASLVICLSTLRGFHRGLSGEWSQLIGVTAALVFGVYFHDPFGSWILAHSHVPARTAYALAFVITAVGVILGMVLLGFLFRRIMKVVFEPKVDKPGGGLAGFISGAILVVIVFMAVNMWPNEYLNRQFGRESIIGRAVVRCTPAIHEETGEIPPVKKTRKEIREAADL